MARCCGGKNAGKPITVPRYLAGLGVFVGYHSVVAVGLHAAAKPLPGLKRVRDFHRRLFLDELKEVVRLEDINIGGLLNLPEEEVVCPIDDGEAARVHEEATFGVAA